MVDVEAGWPLDANANARRPDVADPPNDDGVKWGVWGLACLSGFSKPAMGSPKPLGIINKSEPKPLLTNAHESGNLVNANAMRGNRLIVPLCEKKSIKDNRRVPPSDIMHCGRRTRRRQQRGGILPLLLPAVAAAVLLKKKKKKKVGKISYAQWQANKRQVQQMRHRLGLPPLRSLRML